MRNTFPRCPEGLPGPKCENLKWNLVLKGWRSFVRIKLFCNCFWKHVGLDSENSLWKICLLAKFLARAEIFGNFPKAEHRKGGKRCFLSFPQCSYAPYKHSEDVLHKESRCKTQNQVFVQLEEKYCQTNGFKNNRVMPWKSWDLGLPLFAFCFLIFQVAFELHFYIWEPAV